MTYRNGLFATAFAFAASALSLPAHAGSPVYTAHEVSLSLKLVSQDESSNGDAKARKDSIGTRDVLETCLERTPAKDEAIFLFFVCQDLSQAAQLIAIDKEPLNGLESLGTVELDLTNAITTEKNGVRKSMLVPVEVALSCNANAERLTATGILELKFSAVGELDSCPDSAKVKLTGAGFSTSGPGAFLVNDGSSLTAKKRSASISEPPDL